MNRETTQQAVRNSYGITDIDIFERRDHIGTAERVRDILEKSEYNRQPVK